MSNSVTQLLSFNNSWRHRGGSTACTVTGISLFTVDNGALETLKSTAGEDPLFSFCISAKKNEKKIVHNNWSNFCHVWTRWLCVNWKLQRSFTVFRFMKTFRQNGRLAAKLIISHLKLFKMWTQKWDFIIHTISGSTENMDSSTNQKVNSRWYFIRSKIPHVSGVLEKNPIIFFYEYRDCNHLKWA